MSLIQTIGLFWKPDHVYWGAGSQPGKLLGVPSDNLRSDQIDFREQVGIYVLYADFELVYVGQTGTGDQKLLHRLKQHWNGTLADRWNRFSWFGVRWVKQDGNLSAITKASHPQLNEVLNHIEAIVIHTTEPPLNRQGGRFGADVKWYKQVRDERLGPSQEEMIQHLWNNSDAQE